MIENVVRLFFFLFVIYAVVPRMLASAFGLGVFKQGTGRQEVAVTFDDGPDRGYTPQLLDLLKQYNIKATFFVLGSKAKAAPDLIRRMHEEGHLIGIHNYFHWANSLMTPWRVKREVDESAKVIEEITGQRPAYYRPPWGLLNLFDFIVHKNFRIVLWSLMAWDWRSKGGKEKIRKRLLRRVKAGDVILLHDSGETFGAEKIAPMHMIEALEEVLKETTQKGIKYVRIDEMMRDDRQVNVKMGLWKKMFVSLWMKWEDVFHLIFHVKPIHEDNTLLHVRVKKHSGKSIRLDDGITISKGDRILELHFDNRMLYEMGHNAKTPVHLAIQMIRGVEQLLPEIKERLQNDPAYVGVKGIYGITMIHRGTRQLGFTTLDIPKGLFYYATRLYLKLLMSVIHPQGKERLKVREELLIPKVVAMSKEELMRRYSSEEERKNRNGVAYYA